MGPLNRGLFLVWLLCCYCYYFQQFCEISNLDDEKKEKPKKKRVCMECDKCGLWVPEDEINEHSKGFAPDMQALPTRSTGRYESSRERDAGALAKMLPESPTEEQRAEVAFQAWTDAAIRAPIIHTHHLLQQLCLSCRRWC